MYKNAKLALFTLLFLTTIFPVNAKKPRAHNDTAIEQAILVEVNAYRKKYHLAPLKMEAHISKQAKIHSTNMANHRVPFGHTNFYKRVSVLRKEVKNSGATSENVAFNYKDAHDVVKNWMLSPGHKRNILGNYNFTGVGVVHDAHGTIHFTQMFVKTGAPKQHKPTLYAAQTRHYPQFSFNSIFKRSTT